MSRNAIRTAPSTTTIKASEIKKGDFVQAERVVSDGSFHGSKAMVMRRAGYPVRFQGRTHCTVYNDAAGTATSMGWDDDDDVIITTRRQHRP